jgi:hypothetical protein
MEQKSLQSVDYYQSYIEFYLCYAYAVNPVSLTPMAYSRLRDLRSVRHPSLVAYPWPSVYIVCQIALKPIPLDFSGHVLSSNVIKSVKNSPQKVIKAFKRKVVINKLKIFQFP